MPIRKNIKIGLLLESLVVPAWVFRYIERTAHSDSVEFVMFINATNLVLNNKGMSSTVVYNLFDKVDRGVFKGNPDAFAP